MHATMLRARDTTHLLPEPAAKLLGHALCNAHRRHSARLRAPNLSAAGVADLGEVLGHLGGLSGASLPNHNQHL